MRGASAGETADAIVLAGGRISGLFARAAGTRVKALVPLLGVPLLRHVLDALRATLGIDRICVVGPEGLRPVLPAGCLWQAERESAPRNLLAGMERLDGSGSGRMLVCGADVPVADASAFRDFLDRAPEEGDFCLPLVRKEAFTARFPGNLGIYVRLTEGRFTGGGAYLFRPRALLENEALMEALFRGRKSQIAMARTLGAGLAWRLVTGRLSVTDVEARASELTGFRCRAVPDCRPELAFDVDSLLDLRYAEKWLASRGGGSGGGS